MPTLTVPTPGTSTARNTPRPPGDAARWLSVLVCTRNRAESLSRCLSALLSIRAPAGWGLELVVVDNASTDATLAVVHDCAEQSDYPVRLVREPRIGLSHARNTAMAEAIGELLLFVDDDVLVPATSVAAVIDRFDRDPDLCILGARVEPVEDGACEVTTKTDEHYQEMGLFSIPFGFLHGCALAFRRRVVNEVGAFDTRLGAGSRLHSAEDSDWLYRARRVGMKVAYDPEFRVVHDHGRSANQELSDLLRGYHVGAGAVYVKHISRLDLRMACILARDLSADLMTAARKHNRYHFRGAFLARWRAILTGARRMSRMSPWQNC